jgi:hypothetical protein
MTGVHDSPGHLMDGITALKPTEGKECQKGYAPYRMGTALGRRDVGYQFWRGVPEKLGEFSDNTRAGEPLPPLDNIIEHPLPSWAQ